MRSSTVDNISLLLQALSLEILFRDYNNVDLMQELQRQDKDYLEKIIEQNQQIIKLLKERSDIDGRTSNRENGREHRKNT